MANVGEDERMGDHQTIHHIAKVQLVCRECDPEERAGHLNCAISATPMWPPLPYLGLEGFLPAPCILSKCF